MAIALDMDIDVEKDPKLTAGVGATQFFRLIHAGASRQKIPACAPGLGQHLQAHHFVVPLLPETIVTTHDGDDQHVEVSADVIAEKLSS